MNVARFPSLLGPNIPSLLLDMDRLHVNHPFRGPITSADPLPFCPVCIVTHPQSDHHLGHHSSPPTPQQLQSCYSCLCISLSLDPYDRAFKTSSLAFYKQSPPASLATGLTLDDPDLAPFQKWALDLDPLRSGIITPSELDFFH
jgi:hypothetical protein